MASRPKREFDVNRSWAKLVVASVLLNVILIAGFLTATPTVSPAATWTTGYWKAYYKVRPVSNQADLAALHARSSTLSMEQCVACHGTMLGSKLKLHKIHLGSDLLPGLACPVCHTKVSLEKRSNVKVVRLVDVGVCKNCHSAFPGLSPNSPMKMTTKAVAMGLSPRGASATSSTPSITSSSSDTKRRYAAPPAKSSAVIASTKV